MHRADSGRTPHCTGALSALGRSDSSSDPTAAAPAALPTPVHEHPAASRPRQSPLGSGFLTGSVLSQTLVDALPHDGATMASSAQAPPTPRLAPSRTAGMLPVLPQP